MAHPLPTIDTDALAHDLGALQKELRRDCGPEDLRHLRKIERWGRLATGLGLATAWTIPNPVSVLALALGSFVRWAIVAHHVCHKGYDRIPGVPARYRSQRFAQGRRRFVDWMDWIEPRAWNLEHGTFHHYRLGEDADPDVPETNVEWLRASGLPMGLRQLIVIVISLFWKPFYYAPNTLRVLLNEEAQKRGEDDTVGLYDWALWSPFSWRFWAIVRRCWLPYIAQRFVLLPLLFLPLGAQASGFVLVNLLLAELVSNAWSFWVIVPNHSGEDIHRFDEPARGRGEFFLRQILGSTNYRVGGDWNDFLHGWLNYQVEHHLFPELPARQYQLAHPRVKEICERHGVPLIQESVFTRMRKTMDMMTGRTSLRRYPLASPEPSPCVAAPAA